MADERGVERMLTFLCDDAWFVEVEVVSYAVIEREEREERGKYFALDHFILSNFCMLFEVELLFFSVRH